MPPALRILIVAPKVPAVRVADALSAMRDFTVTVTTASTVAAARRAAAQTPDLVFCDARQLRTEADLRTFAPSPVVVLRPDASNEAKVFGAFDVLTPEEILPAVLQRICARIVESGRCEERVRALVENLNEVVYEMDAEGRFTYLSPVLHRVYGIEASAMLGRSFADFLHPDDIEDARAGFARVLRGEGMPNRFRVRTPSGDVRFVQVSSRIRFEDGAIAGVSGILTDLTPDISGREEVIESRLRAQQCLDLADVVFLSLDARKCLTMLNRLGEEICGASERELLGRSWIDVTVPEEDRAALDNAFDRLLEGQLGPPPDTLIPLLGGDGRVHHLQWRFSPLHGVEGEVVGILGAGVDVTGRSEMERETRRMGDRLDMALAGADLGVWEWEIAEDTCTFSPKALTIAGVEDGACRTIRQALEQLLQEDEAARALHLLDEHLAGRTDAFQHEGWFVPPGGEWRWVVTHARVVERGPDNTPVRVSGTWQDRTGWKFAELALRESEEKFRLLAEGSSDVIWLCTADGTIQFVSASVETLLGISPDEARRRGLAKILAPEELERDLLGRLRGRIERINAGGAADGIHTWETALLHGDGSTIWVESLITFLTDPQGRVSRIQGSTRDITRRVRAQRALEDSEEKYRLLVEHQTDLIARLDLDGRIMFVSPSCCRVFGRTEEQLLGSTFPELVHESDRAEAARSLHRVVDAPHRSAGEWRLLTADGWRWFAWSMSGLPGSSGEIRTVVGAGRDITERKRTEQALIASERKLRTVVANLPVVLFSTDLAGNFTLSEGTALSTLGLQPGQVVGVSVFEIYHEHHEILDCIRRALAGEDVYRVVSVDRRDWETWYAPLVGDGGAIEGMIGVSVDITERMTAERELDRHRNHLQELVEARTLELERANERLNRFRFALDSAADSIFIIDPKTFHFLDLNDPAAEATGYSRDDLLTMSLPDLLHQFPRELLRREFDAVLADHSSVGVLSAAFRRRDGDTFPAEGFLRAFPSVMGTLVIASVRNISRRVQAERAMRESETKYRSVLENANEAIIVIQDFRIRFFNPKAVDLSGLAPERLLGMKFLDFVHPRDMEIVHARIRQRLERRQATESFELRMFDTSGTIKWLEIRDVVIEWEGRPAMLNFLNDITARKHAEEFIGFQASLLNVVHNTVVALDLTGRINFWNHFAEQAYGWTASEAIGMKAADIGVFDDEIHRNMFERLRSSGHFEEEVERITRDGRPIPEYCSWSCITTAGTITGYVGIGVDLTERRKLERDLLQSQKLASLGILSEGIAHELRNPLGFASSAAQLLMTKKNLDEATRTRYSEAIYNGVKRANTIVENLLLVGKPKGQLMKTSMNVLDAINEAISILSSHAAYPHVTIEQEYPPETLRIRGNMEMLVQLFHNLFVNALNEMPGGGTLRIIGRHLDGGGVEVRVRDSGPGIPSDIAGNIFDPFFTASSSGKGVGLGLTLCYFIMDDHDGRIAVEPRDEPGAEFVLTFLK